jgi:hypothetical protein
LILILIYIYIQKYMHLFMCMWYNENTQPVLWYEFIFKQEWQPWVSTISPNLNFSLPISSRFNRSTFVNRSYSPCLAVCPSWKLPKTQGEDCEGHVCRSYSRASRASATSSDPLQCVNLQNIYI